MWRNFSVTSHQKLRICAKVLKKLKKKSTIQAKMKLNKRSDVPFMVRLRSIYGPLTIRDMVGDMARVMIHDMRDEEFRSGPNY
jgi:hypothetical protein